jgi:hypothetical protein
MPPAPATLPTARSGNRDAPYTWDVWDRARAAGIEGRSGLSRDALIALLDGR